MTQGVGTFVGSTVVKRRSQTYDGMEPVRLSDEEYAKSKKRHGEVMSWAQECLSDIERAEFFSAFGEQRFADAHHILEDHGGWPWQRVRWSRWLADLTR